MTARLLGKDETFEDFSTQNIEEAIRLHTPFLPVSGNSDLTSPFGAETVNTLYPEPEYRSGHVGSASYRRPSIARYIVRRTTSESRQLVIGVVADRRYYQFAL
ncbi:hypothetical protein J6590_077801 [Homalodisca vitripennis]|nr:hypothetical protein J6590_077801 [Homalodisca vitripennis]